MFWSLNKKKNAKNSDHYFLQKKKESLDRWPHSDLFCQIEENLHTKYKFNKTMAHHALIRNLDLEAELAHALFVSLDEILTVLFTLFNDT